MKSPGQTLIRAYVSDRVLINQEKKRQKKENPFLKTSGALIIHEALRRYDTCPECGVVLAGCRCGKKGI